MSEIAFVIGNGTSRKGFDLLQLKDHGIVYGCNALYRDFRPKYELPHYLVAIDAGMITEIESSDFPSSRFIVPPLAECWEPADCNPNRPRSNAGMNAIREAIKRGSKVIIAMGFDFMLMDEKQSVSNMYDGTANYGPDVRANHLDNFNRANYMSWVAETNPSVNIFLVYPTERFPDKADMHRIIRGGNIFTLDYGTLVKNL